MSIPVILASTSPSRQRLLRNAGIRPIICPSYVDEDATLQRFADQMHTTLNDIPAESRVLVLSGAKAKAVHERLIQDEQAISEATGTQITVHTNAQSNRIRKETTPIQQVIKESQGYRHYEHGPLIIGSDSLFEIDGHIYGKPHTIEAATQRLKRMRNQHGTLWTGHTIIDMATGKTLRAIESAIVNFDDFNDNDIEQYIKTREPLEVAGSFTLDGIGGAFIKSIDGDPHCVIGLSINRVRTMVQDLDINWTDLWNNTTATSNYIANNTNEHPYQPGDQWIDCTCGHKHWGINGAAGMLIARRDTNGNISDILLQRRAEWTAEGGTWGIPGGALATGENAFEGAMRESLEEANITANDIYIVGSYVEDHGKWSYTTVFAFEKQDHQLDPKANDDESLSIEWVPFEKVKELPLLSYFKNDWTHFSERLIKLSHEM